jgi:hypothetical protein
MIIKLDFYYRQGCHLCEDMLALITPYQSLYSIQIQMHDIDEDAELKEQYGLLIPVLKSVQGEEICHYFFDKAGFEEFIHQRISK